MFRTIQKNSNVYFWRLAFLSKRIALLYRRDRTLWNGYFPLALLNGNQEYVLSAATCSFYFDVSLGWAVLFAINEMGCLAILCYSTNVRRMPMLIFLLLYWIFSQVHFSGSHFELYWPLLWRFLGCRMGPYICQWSLHLQFGISFESNNYWQHYLAR